MKGTWILLALLLFAKGAHAIPAPGLEWSTVTTDCCNIHFHKELKTQALRVANDVDAAVAFSASLLGSQISERINIVISDATDVANGWATSVPYNLVHVFSVPPTRDNDLSKTDDHLRMVLLHEIFHIVHLDNVGGLPAWTHTLLGKLWLPNFVLPRWIHEGTAVYTETRFTNAGRLRSPRWRAHLRAAALAGDLWSLDDVSNYSRRPPAGNAAYLYGGAFIDFAFRTYGEDWLSKFNNGYAERVIPYSISRTFSDATGVTLDDAWTAFLAALTQQANDAKRAHQQREKASALPDRRVTRLGGTWSRPSFVPGSPERFYAINDAPNQASTLVAVEGLPAQAIPKALARMANTDGIVALDDNHFVVCQREITENRFNFSDLFLLSRERNEEKSQWTKTQITHGARVHNPVLSEDKDAVFVLKTTGTENAILKVQLSDGEISTVVSFDSRRVPYGLALSPDGRTLATTLPAPMGSAGFGRDLTVFDLSDENAVKVERLPFKGDEVDLSFHPNGTLYFSSDRDGVFNIFAYDFNTSQFRRATDFLLGAFSPQLTEDGLGLLVQSTHLEGSDFYMTDANALTPLTSDLVADTMPKTDKTLWQRPARIVTEPSRYNPLPTLLPRRWFPLLESDALEGMRPGIAVEGMDAIEAHRIAAEFSYGIRDKRPRLSLVYNWLDSYFPLELRAAWNTERSDARRINGEPSPHVEKTLRFSGTVSFRLRRFLRSHRVSLGYSREFRFVDEGELGDPSGRSPAFPSTENVGPLTLRWSYSDIQRFRDSISNENGLSMSVAYRVANAFTLSEIDINEVTFNLRFFKSLPQLSGHVFGVYLAGGFAQGERGRRSLYSVGGTGEREVIRDLIDGVRFGEGVLRGYPRAVDVGDGFGLATFEYRFPLVNLERGVQTLPVFVERISGALYSDVGQAFNTAPDLQSLRMSLGMEGRLDLLFGYYGRIQLRFGFARGLQGQGISQPYLLVGSPF